MRSEIRTKPIRRSPHAFLCSPCSVKHVSALLSVWSSCLGPRHKKNPQKASQVESLNAQCAPSLTGMLARLCGCLGIVNVAAVGALSPNTARAYTDSGMPGFHHT